jgi:hypothetical protein
MQIQWPLAKAGLAKLQNRYHAAHVVVCRAHDAAVGVERFVTLATDNAKAVPYDPALAAGGTLGRQRR